MRNEVLLNSNLAITPLHWRSSLYWSTRLYSAVLGTPICYCTPYLTVPKIIIVSVRPSIWTLNDRGQRARSFWNWGLSGRILLPFPFLSWGEAGTGQGRSFLLLSLSSLPTCKTLHFAMLNCFTENFMTPVYSCGAEPEPLGWEVLVLGLGEANRGNTPKDGSETAVLAPTGSNQTRRRQRNWLCRFAEFSGPRFLQAPESFSHLCHRWRDWGGIASEIHQLCFHLLLTVIFLLAVSYF